MIPRPGGVMLGVSPGPEWTNAAMTWPVVLVQRETEPGHWLTDVVPVDPLPPLTQQHLCCVLCEGLPSLFCMSPGRGPEGYTTTAGHVLAGILAHIRRSHPDVVPS